MGDEEHGALVALEGVHQHLLGGDVEVIRGLVEHEEVRGIVEQASHDEAGLFATGEQAAELLGVVAREAEGAGEVLERADGRHGEGPLERLDDGLVAGEELHRMLREVAHLDARSDGEVAGVRA